MYITLISLICFLVVVTGGLSLRMFFEKKKGDKDWSAWANLISAAGTVVVGVATIFVMFQENSIQNRLAKMEEAEHQPIFVVKEVQEQSPGSVVFDYCEFYVYNHGALVKSIDKVSADVFIKIGYSNADKKRESYAPVKDYYYRYYRTGALQGDIAHSYGAFKNHNNLYYVSRFYNSQSIRYSDFAILTELVKTYKIEYVDIYGEHKQVCFIGESETSLDNYNSIHRIAETDFGTQAFELESVNIDDIIDCLEK